MVIAICDGNECNFGIKIDDASTPEVVEKVKAFMKEGLAAWYCATDHPEEWEDETYFTREEVEGMEGMGYAEPTMELLTREGIPFKCVNVKYNKDDEVIADEVIWY